MTEQTNNDSVTFEVIPTQQNGIRMYIGKGTGNQLNRVTTVDHYDPHMEPTDERQGYQRPPERSRITQIGKFLMQTDGEAIFPTSVLLGARHPLAYDRSRGVIDVPMTEPLQIIDGQHRLAGIKYAAEEKGATHVGEYDIPFVIIETPNKMIEMNQFRIVNGTAKQVRTDLVNMILTAIYSETGRTDIPKKDLWRIVVSNVVDHLAKDPQSPWRDLVALPGEVTVPGEAKPVRATSFITSLKPVYVWLKEASGILDMHCHNTDEEIDYMYRVVADYWRALRQVVPGAFEDPMKNVIQKTPGVFSLHLLLRHLLGSLYQGRRSFDVATFTEFLNESPEITDPDFWYSESNRASVYGSMKGFQDLYDIIKGPYQL